jgi:hypothetical protein
MVAMPPPLSAGNFAGKLQENPNLSVAFIGFMRDQKKG